MLWNCEPIDCKSPGLLYSVTETRRKNEAPGDSWGVKSAEESEIKYYAQITLYIP